MRIKRKGILGYKRFLSPLIKIVFVPVSCRRVFHTRQRRAKRLFRFRLRTVVAADAHALHAPHSQPPPSTSLVCGDNSTRCLERGEATGSKTMFSLPSFILFNMLGVDSLRFFKLYDRS